jgi:hypothetical protein
MIRQLAVIMGHGKPIEAGAKYRREICRVGRWMYRQGFVVASEGNLSVRLDADRVLVTPAGACKGRLLPHELIITDLEGTVVAGSGQPSSELQMHLFKATCARRLSRPPPHSNWVCRCGSRARRSSPSGSRKRSRQNTSRSIWDSGHQGTRRRT